MADNEANDKRKETTRERIRNMTTQTTNEQAAWEAFQMRTAIILGLEIFHKRTELQKRVAARGDRAPEPHEAAACAFECASFAEAALLRVKSVRGTDRAITAFTARLVRHCLCKWMDRETKRRNRFTAMTPEVEERVNNIPAPVSDAAERARLIALVRLTVRSLPPRARRVCELYMRLGTLEEVRKALNMTNYEFFGHIWPACQKKFKENAKKIEVKSFCW